MEPNRCSRTRRRSGSMRTLHDTEAQSNPDSIAQPPEAPTTNYDPSMSYGIEASVHVKVIPKLRRADARIWCDGGWAALGLGGDVDTDAWMSGRTMTSCESCPPKAET
jgi:hypothetical protein